jgi:hypothetical protein
MGVASRRPKGMVVNISQVESFLECPRLWWWKYHLKRGHDEGRASYDTDGSNALDVGKLWHRVAAGEEALPLDAPLWMVRAYESLLAWEDAHKDVTTIGNELELRATLESHVLVGRLDRLVSWRGKLWHFQHKTIAPSKPLGVFKRLIARSFHEVAYAYLVCNTSEIPLSNYGGTILAVVRKLSDKSLALQEPFSVEYLPLSGYMELVKNLKTHIDAMESWIPPSYHPFGLNITATAVALINPPRKPKGLPPQNPSACGGKYGNKLCQYIDACEGRADISSYPQLDPFEGYAENRSALLGS